MLEKLKQEVLEANKKLQSEGLVVLTWGNVSGRDSETGLVVIKASGVEYSKMTTDDLVVVNMDGDIVEGKLNPSTDIDTHLVIYKNFKDVHGVVHTHSTFATIWAQMEENIPCYGTTHADYFPGVIPVTREMTEKEISGNYEKNTGEVIAETFKELNPNEIRAVLVKKHGPFVWGASASDALHNAIVLEQVSKMGLLTKIGSEEKAKEVSSELLTKHYNRKFGVDAYYGQE